MNSDEDEMGEVPAEQVDRISTLPDAILTRILSLLPTKYSVRTSALSTRWAHLYASVPVLVFHHRSPDPAFVGLVSKLTHKLSRISKFCIHLDALSDNSHILSWIDSAISNSVQELDVRVALSAVVPTPHRVFTSESLVSLSLDVDFALSVPEFVCLPNLKELFLKKIVLRDESDDESVRRLFSSCPVLERLSVHSWWMHNARVFNVSVPSLKFLIVFLPRVFSEYKLLINCPNLEILRCEGYADGGYSGDILTSLNQSYIDIELHEDQLKDGKLIELVKQVRKVRFLSLAGDSMEVLLSPPCSLPTFENLTHLELHSLYSEGWRLLPSLLESSPRLETLVFPRGFYDRNDFLVPFSLPEQAPVCLSSHLKVIRINRFYGEEDEYKLVEYFLMNALVLEKLEICPWSSGGSEEENDQNVEGEVGNEGEGPMDVDCEGDGNGSGESDGEGEGEGQEHGHDEEEGEGEFGSDLERHFEITKRLLTFRRFSEVCQIDIVSPEGEDD